MNPREDVDKAIPTRARSTDRKENRASSRNDNRERVREKDSRVIHNSNSSSVLNLSKSSSGDSPTDDDLGARPKAVQPVIIYGRLSGRRGSVDSARYRPQTEPNNKASRNGTNSSQYRAEKFQDIVRHAEDIPPTDNSKQIKANDNSALQTGKIESKTQVRPMSDELENYTQSDERESQTSISTHLQDKEMGNRNKKKVKEEQSKKSLKKRGKASYKENCPPKKHRAKITNLYVVLDKEISETNDVKPFLQHRMGSPKALNFELASDSDKIAGRNNCNLITMKFESYNKATAARHLLHVSNRNTSSKVSCFFEKGEAKGQAVDRTQERQCKLENALSEIDETVSSVSHRHEAKILDVLLKLSEVERQLGKKRGLSLPEFERFSNEKLAFKDKFNELERQLKEYKQYIDNMKIQLTQLIRCENFEKELNKIKKAFGVECRRLENALPMYARREDILTTVNGNQVCVILGETGSGKSTQMVQYLYQAGFAVDGLIACTQPRKIAAINLATRVASELASGVGQEVGYKVGMQCKMSANTKVLFMTDHILLNECLYDEVLSKYSCILIDEAHERSIFTDLLLGMLKKALTCRQDLKVIITSATIDPDVFVDYFGGINICPVLKVSGRTFPVDIFWEQDSYFENSFPDDYQTKALNKAIEIHQTEAIEGGDILVFLTSATEIERCTERLKKSLGESDVQCLQLHGKLKAEEQQLVFRDTPPRKRKIVFATNSAETSITIPGIKFVIDSGVVKEMRFDPKKQMNSLDVVPVSQSSANQRKGRAGRTARGVCYRLYTSSDFKQMSKMSSPEIHRIQISQALLKLIELGAEPTNFDFVQCPSNEALRSAMSELVEIGAVNETGMTDLGKWIAKLPVQPRLGVFIKKGIDMEIVTEALVVAACCNQSGIFVRVGSQEEKEAADVKKMKFCHLGGDLLTMLNVYREWDKIQERSKGRWCQSNSINGKAMKNVREIAYDIITSLKKESDMKLKHNFKNANDTDSLVEKLVFECMSSNLGYYLGHESAGYLVVNRFQRVQIHPSSAVMSLGLNPGWVVFNRILKTSADFMTEVTPISGVLVNEAVEKGKLSFDLKSLESQKVHCALTVPIGKHIYWKFVCSMHRMRRQIEDDIRGACNNSLIVVEANKQRGEISLFCLPEYKDEASVMLLSFIESMRQQLLNESREEFIGSDESGVRVVLRLGGTAVDILMPNEFRSLNIKQSECSWSDLDEESLKEIFEFYGPIEQLWRPIGKKQFNSPFWGKVTFTHEIDAVAALDYINEDSDCDISLKPITYHNQKSSSQQGFTMKVTWCRRPAKNHCFICLNRPEDSELLLRSMPRINGKRVTISQSKQQSDLYVKGILPDVTEEQIKNGLANELGLSLNTCQTRFRVIIPRMNTIFRPGEWLEKQEELISIVSRYARRDSFRINVLEYREKTVIGVAFVTYSDSQVCYDATQKMIDDDLSIDGRKLNISLECKSTVHIKKRLYDALAEDIEHLIDTYKRKNSSTFLGIRHLKSGNISFDIKAITPQKLAKTKVRVDRIVGGDVLECGEKENLHTFFCSDAKNIAKDIEKATGTMIFVDERQMKVTIQGPVGGRIRAVDMIEDFTFKQKKSTEVEFRLKGEDNPPGLLKALLKKYGIRFEALKKDTNISGMKLNLRYHEITITGPEEAVKLAVQRIKELREEIAKRDEVVVLGRELPDCPICLCPVEETDMYRLEFCGHAYCKICFTSQIQSAVSDRKLPVICAAEDCNKPLVIRDINVQIKMGSIKKKEFVDAAVGCLVIEKNESFRFCITPNCKVVYRTSSNGTRFICPVCQENICTCAMYRSAKRGDGSVKKWVKENPKMRKMCPKCSLGIEKIEGCDHIKCKCGAHICWKCLKYFSDNRACYGHLKDAHGSFV